MQTKYEIHPIQFEQSSHGRSYPLSSYRPPPPPEHSVSRLCDRTLPCPPYHPARASPGRYDRSSLRVLGCVGEPLNHEAWQWYNDVVGDGRCAVIDTWWQTGE